MTDGLLKLNLAGWQVLKKKKTPAVRNKKTFVLSANERGLCVTAGIGLAVVSTTQAAERGQKRHAGINALNPLITWSVTHKTTVPPQKP